MADEALPAALKWVSDTRTGTLSPHLNAIEHRTSGMVQTMGALTHTSTLDRMLVHRWSISEVFVTDLRCDGPAAVTAAAQWPRQHAFFDDGHGMYCLLLAAETFRQVTLAGLHATGLADRSDQLVMKRMGFAWSGKPPAVGDRPLDLRISLSISPTGRADRFDLRVAIDAVGAVERNVLTGTGLVIVLTPRVYAGLRNNGTEVGTRIDALATIPCEAVGRTRAQDVVLTGPEQGPWELRVDTTHPTLFDHPCDHIPGMLLFEAARQAVLVRGRARSVVSVDADFGAFMELSAPVYVSLESEGGVFAVTIRQSPMVGARFSVTVGP